MWGYVGLLARFSRKVNEKGERGIGLRLCARGRGGCSFAQREVAKKNEEGGLVRIWLRGMVGLCSSEEEKEWEVEAGHGREQQVKGKRKKREEEKEIKEREGENLTLGSV
jgi:hypothetical protein